MNKLNSLTNDANYFLEKNLCSNLIVLKNDRYLIDIKLIFCIEEKVPIPAKCRKHPLDPSSRISLVHRSPSNFPGSIVKFMLGRCLRSHAIDRMRFICSIILSSRVIWRYHLLLYYISSVSKILAQRLIELHALRVKFWAAQSRSLLLRW